MRIQLSGEHRHPSGDDMTASKSRSALILVVDDDPGVRPLIADVLALDGHEVDTATNGWEALDRVAARSYDLVVSDLRMPELDGVGLYRELARRYPALLRRMAFVTGTTEPPEYQRFLADTGLPVLHKPFDVTELCRFIHRLL